jgi:N4-gp56 family major capsid protein
MSQIYNSPVDGNESSIGTQIRTDHFDKKALIEAKKEQYFSQLADVTSMPKHFGKKIKKYHYLPLLDDANINDQGIDAAGVTTTREVTIEATTADGEVFYYVGEGANDAAALTAAEAKALEAFAYEPWGIDTTNVLYDTYAEAVAAYVNGATSTVENRGSLVEHAGVAESGNLYGSSKDVGTISGKMPALSENGGRVNRVGFKRVELEGNIEKFGFFDEYTQESLDFDSDSELEMHIRRESVMGANEITEDALQIDLLNGAGVIRYAGAAASTAEISGETGGVTTVTYEDLMKLSITLDNNRTPKNTKVITGSRMVDTKTIDAARYIYCGSELLPTLRRMKDLHNNEAFIPVQKYAAAGNTATGEVGSIDQFRIIVVPEMMHWAGVGAAESTNDGYRATAGQYDVFPMLVVGSMSFTTIGFQTDGKTVKFKITHKKPGRETADRNDPYGETGFYSIKWYYGTMILRPERIALVKTVAEW